MRRSMIAAVGANRELGAKNALLWHIPEDFAHFKAVTMGKPVIMGMNTYRSIGKPLPGRLNIVLSRTTMEIPGVHVVGSLAEAYAVAEASGATEVFNIGGESVYALGLSDTDRLYITEVQATFPEADAFFPEYKTLFSTVVDERESSGGEFIYSFKILER